MESGDGVRVKTAISHSGLITVSRGGALVDSRTRTEMEIIQFPANIDKFTGFFDKYLKTNGLGVEAVNNNILVSYEDRFKQNANILSKFIE